MKLYIVPALCSLWCWTMGYICGFRAADDVEYRQCLKLIKERLKKLLKG